MKNKREKNEKKANNIAISLYEAFKSFSTALPTLFGVILLISLFHTFVSKQMISSVFSGNVPGDTFIGSMIGSVSAGNPLTSYIIGGELLKDQVSLFAVTAFIVAWVTVGIIQLPAEVTFLGKRFAFTRNGLSFILAIFVSIATVTTLTVIQ